MFRPQRMPRNEGYFEPCLPTVEEVDDSYITSIKSQTGEPLPPCDNFDLKKMIEANVPLEQTNSKILGSRIVPSEFLSENRNDKSVDKSIDESIDSDT